MNGLRKVRAFIKDEGHADFYPGLKINFISGKPPELVCFKAEEEVERTDVSKMETHEIHSLVLGKGYRRRMPLSLAAKAAKGDAVTKEDWAEFLEVRAQRTRARAQWSADDAHRRRLAELDAELASRESPVGTSGRWLVARRSGELPDTHGVQYRNSMDAADRAEQGALAKWESEVRGVLAAEGWVQAVSRQFLPVFAGEVRILRLVEEDDKPSAEPSARATEL